MDREVEQLGGGPIVGLGRLERGDVGKDASRRARDHARIAERLEVHALGGLHLHVASHAAARTYGVEAHRRDACSLGDLHGLAVEREQPHRVGRHVDESREVAFAVAKARSCF